ncbi:MAG: aspartate--tRNA ligase [Prevotellaceae bacterium]|jgi:aspartyl-tRNA synthetase|nr:aspartate--tRNA ligase [Prevotellaceae bacterium]
MYRTHTCGELRLQHKGQPVTLAGWVQRIRNLGGMTFIDLRDRYGITQLTVNDDSPSGVKETAAMLGREFVLQTTGTVLERSNKNPKITTGDIEIGVTGITVLNVANTPPFTIEDESDGGEELRARYRYLDLRRNPLQKAIHLRHRMAQEVRKYLDSQRFLEIETPFLIKSTPEGARDFVVPSRMNPGEFYALPQSPQTFKQLLMVAGYDRYFQIVRCFRDEDLRADRQPEFTQIDCEMAFVEREDILQTFEGLARHLFKSVLGIEWVADFPRISYADAMNNYGSDKPDIRFDMRINDLTDAVKGKNFILFDSAEYIGGICIKGCADYTRKQLDELTEWVKRPQIGAKGLVYIRWTADGIKSSIDKFYTTDELSVIAAKCRATQGDLILLLSGDKKKTLEMIGSLRIEMGNRLGLRPNNVYAPLWVYDFPLLEWDDETQRFYAMHHPFTSPKPEDLPKFYSANRHDITQVNANAYDFVLNGVEIGGGSIRIHDSGVQRRMFEVLGFSEEEANYKFGFIINAFRYGAPPHGGIAFGFDRWCALFGGQETIRDYIAFPKNNTGRDVMLDAPSKIDEEQMKELYLKSVKSEA